MSTPDTMTTGDFGGHRNQRGSALLLAMIMILILTFLGFGLLSRSLLVSQIAGAERWTAKAFYAADSGINVAKARLKIQYTDEFQFQIQDYRGYSGTGQAGWINVQVTEFENVGRPMPIPGNEAGGGQGSGSEPLYSIGYKGTSTSTNLRTRSEAVISTTQTLSPVPLHISGPS